MAKWADYCIIAVKYGKSGAIEQVKALPDGGDSLGAVTFFSRADVVDRIARGTTFVTAYLKDGNYSRGEDVHVVKIGVDHYLRTDRNNVRADNLANLPAYA